MVALLHRARGERADVAVLPSFSVMNWPPWVSLLMSVEVRPSRYFAFSASLPKFASSFAQPSVTLIGQPMPNSVWLNRKVKACFATTGYLSGQPMMPCDRHRVDADWP